MKQRYLTTIILFLIVCYPAGTLTAQTGQETIDLRKQHRNTNTHQPATNNTLNSDQTINAEPVETPTTFGLNWTNSYVHRFNNYDAIELILEGSIQSDRVNIWQLSPEDEDYSLHFLTFINDVENQSRDGVDPVELNWFFALNGSEYEPVEIGDDGNIFIEFPAGDHTFKLKIEGLMRDYQLAGHYGLYMKENLSPQL